MYMGTQRKCTYDSYTITLLYTIMILRGVFRGRVACACPLPPLT